MPNNVAMFASIVSELEKVVVRKLWIGIGIGVLTTTLLVVGTMLAVGANTTTLQAKVDAEVQRQNNVKAAAGSRKETCDALNELAIAIMFRRQYLSDDKKSEQIRELSDNRVALLIAKAAWAFPQGSTPAERTKMQTDFGDTIYLQCMSAD